MKVLVIGGGGREHALAWKLARSPKVEEVIVAPGNAGTAREPGLRNAAVAATDLDGLLALARDEDIGLTVVGPEAPLAAGLVDRFQAAGLPCFGPSRAAAQLEASKAFSKDFLARHGIPTARYAVFESLEPALAYVREQGAPIVVKADGLAAGKGVTVATTLAEAEAALRDCLGGGLGGAGARVVVDGVAYAPHRLMDVARWGVDWYVYSTYKVFGPHMAALYGRHDAWAELEGPNHFFLPGGNPYKFELGGPNHEGCAGLLALSDYLRFLADEPGDCLADRKTVERAMTRVAELEARLQQALIEGLRAIPGVRIVGPNSYGPERVATISFLHDQRSPSEICAATDAPNVGIRYGHMYAYRLCQAMGIGTNEGVVRVSAAHYNTFDEIDDLLRVVA